MSKQKHTPEPWYADTEVKGWWGGDIPACMVSFEISHHTYAPIAMCHSRDVGEEQAKANARLIAVAPDLLRELRHLVRLLETLEWSARDEWRNDQCPTCDGAQVHGHAEGCELAARLNEARAAIKKASEPE